MNKKVIVTSIEILDDVFNKTNAYTGYTGFHIKDRDEAFDRRVSILIKMIKER